MAELRHRKDMFRWPLAATAILGLSANGVAHAQAFWGDYAGNAQHTGLSTVGSQDLSGIIWQTSVDLNPQYSGNDLLIHYGSPVITQANTVIVAVKTGATDGFMLKAINGTTGAVKWTATSDYTMPPHDWTPSYGPTIAPTGRLYYAGAGGTIYYQDNIDSASPTAPTQVAFYGNSTYNANKTSFNANVEVCTPLTTDKNGDVYFGYRVIGGTPNGLASGIARIGADGSTTYMSAASLTGGVATQIPLNCAPAITADGKTLYIGMSDGSQTGYLVSLNAADLSFKAKIACPDPRGSSMAGLIDDSSASPMIAPDGSVFYGVLDNPYYSSKGWMLHFNGDLTTEYTPGNFGWDDTASIVPASMVPSYSGSSSYLIFTKYNDYFGTGGSGQNKIAILDPNATQVDPRTGVTVMKEVMSITGPTLDSQFPGTGAVREWCINDAVVDPFTDSIIANSEDGILYRWDLASNTFSQSVTLTPGVGEAYTPTVIGADGTVYAINNATLFAVGTRSSSFGTPEPGALALLAAGAMFAGGVYRRRKRASRL